MNKDVVYIEPDDDITDVIARVKGAKSKIVALVPPKKAGVFRSIVNIKLITKSAQAAEKTVVLVTTDPSIIKLAAATKLPVTKDLKSAPEVPAMEDIEEDGTEVVDVDDEAEETKEEEEKEEETEEVEKDDESKDREAEEKKEEEKSEPEEEGEEDDEDKEEKEEEKEKTSDKDSTQKQKKEERKKSSGKLANSNNPVLKWIGVHPKSVSGICVGLVGIIILSIWAFGIAPAVSITLKLETSTGNFSESVFFTQNLAEENIAEGKFFVEERKIEDKTEIEFEATGQKNVGEKASGTLTVYHIFKEQGSAAVNAGTAFSYNKLNYLATDNNTLTWGGKDSECKNKDDDNIGTKGCYIYKDIAVKAAEAGANYNISATSGGWATNSGVTVASSSAMDGGSDKTVTIVQQSDIDKALKDTTTENEAVNKQKLLDTVSEDQFAIDSSFKQTVSDPKSEPAVGEEVAEGKKAKVTVTTTDTIFILDKTKLKEFIKEKAKLGDGYKIYEMNDPFIENFTKVDNGFIGKLKTVYVSGSTITENEVVDTIKGKGIGSAKRDLTDNFKGIKTITIDTSVPWVTAVPNNAEKITVKIDVEE